MGGGLFSSSNRSIEPPDPVVTTAQTLYEKAQRYQEIVLNCIQIGNLYCQLGLDEEKRRVEEAINKPGGVAPTSPSTMAAAAFGGATSLLRQPFSIENAALLECISDSHLVNLANSWYDKALQAWPNHFLVLYFRARLAALSGKIKSGIQYISDCLEQCKLFLPGLFLRGTLYIRQGLLELALFDLIRIRKQMPSYPRLLVNIGYCYYQQQNFDKAVQVLSESLEYTPSDPQTLYLRGCALQELSCLERAIDDFSACVSLAMTHTVPPATAPTTAAPAAAPPNEAPVPAPMKESAPLPFYDPSCLTHSSPANSSGPASAPGSVSKVDSGSPPPGRALYQRAVCNLVLQRYALVVDDMRQVLSWQPDFQEGLQLMAYAHFWMAKYEEAAIFFTRALAVMGSMEQDPKVYCYRALANYYAKNESAAMVDIELAIRKDPKDMINLLLKAKFLMDRGLFDPALDCLLRATPYSWSLNLLPSSIFDNGDTTSSNDQDDSDPLRDQDSMALRAAAVLSESSRKDAKSGKPQLQCIDLFASRKRHRQEMLLKYLPTNYYSPPVRQHVASPRMDDPATVNGHLPKRGSFMDPSDAAHAQAEGSIVDRDGKNKDHDNNPENDPVRKRHREICYRLIRALKKITFGNRLVKSIEESTASKLLASNQAFVHKVNQLMQSKTKILWPKGTPTNWLTVWAFNTLGVFYLQRRKLNEALRAFTVGIQTDPSQSQLLFNRGNVYLFMELFGPSLTCFQDAISVFPGCFAAHNNLGVALYNLKKYDEAQQAFSTGLHYVSDTSNVDATQKALLCFNLGVIFQVLDKQPAAMEFYQEAIQLDPTRADFLNNRSMMYHQQLKFTMALADYDRALRLHELDEQRQQCPKTPDGKNSDQPPDADHIAEGKCFQTRMNRAQLFISMGHCSAAIHDLQVAIEALHTAKANVEAAKNATTLTTLSVLGRHNSSHFSMLNQQKLTEVSEMDSALQMLRFCETWRLALRAALNDFLYALNGFPCFAACHVNLQQMEEQLTETEPLDPILDKRFIDGELLIAYCQKPPVCLTPLSSTRMSSSTMPLSSSGTTSSPKKKPNEFHALLVQALYWCLRDEYETALAMLLRAHYLTILDSHEEYLIMFWRSQLHYSAGDTGEAIALLKSFLDSRRTRDEVVAVQMVLRQAQESAIARESMDEHSTSSANEEFGGLESISDTWFKQRRVIRADGYVYLGSLFLVQNQRKQAMESFLSALAIRPDHAFAIMNALRLSVAEKRYEAALDFIIKLFDVTKSMNTSAPATTTANNNKPSDNTSFMINKPSPASAATTYANSNQTNNENDAELPGLLHLNRSLRAQLGHVASAISNDPKVSDLFAQIYQLLRDYRSLLTAQVQSHYPEIFRKQGRLVRLIEELDSHLQLINRKSSSMTRSPPAIKSKDQVQRAGGFNSSKAVAMLGFSSNDLVLEQTNQLQLDQLNQIADECTNMILTDPQSFHSDHMFQQNQVRFNAHYDRVCDALANTLSSKIKEEEVRHGELSENRDSSSSSSLQPHRPAANSLRRKPSGRSNRLPKD